MDEDYQTYQVEVYLYDLSRGGAKLESQNVIGRCIEGVWHTGVVAFGREYSFNKKGVVSVIPGASSLGDPTRIESVGETQLPYSVFLDYLLSLSDTKFKSGSWDLVKFNSNTFSDEICQFLCGCGLPKFIFDLPLELLTTSVWTNVTEEAEKLSESGVTLGLIGSRHLESISDNFIPRNIHDNSPDLEELQSQIQALRADQLTLNERRNALNSKDSLKEEKKKKKRDKEDKKEKKERKEKKIKKKQNSEDQLSNSSPELCCVRGTRSLYKSSSCDTQSQSQSRSKHTETGANESQSDTQCDINSVTTAAEAPADISEPTPSGSAKVSDNSLIPSPTHSILSNSRSSDKSHLRRTKTLKRVSFDEKPDIIEEPLETACDTTENTSDKASGSNNLNEEEIKDPPPLEEVRARTPQTRSPTPPPTMASAEEQQIEIPTDGDGEPVMPKKERKPHIKGITFREFDHVKDFEDLVRTIVTMCSSEEQERLREMEDWIVKNEGTWVLSEGFNTFLSNVFHRQDWPSDARVAMMRLLAYGAKEDDIVLILHMDRKDHSVMNYAQQFDRLPVKEQESLALLFCNLFETASASEWLMYISEWDAPGGGLPLSNIRVTTKVAVNSLLGDTPGLVDYGSALMANLGDKEVKAVVFDDVCSELAMAILQFFQNKPPEEQVFRCMKALLKFCTIGSREVPQLVKMIGPEPSKFTGLSKRVDELIEPIMARLASVPMF